MNGELEYLKMLEYILANGYLKENRTGISAYTTMPTVLQHDMKEGFPLLTTKKLGIKSVAAELEFFIKGLSDKQWLKDRKCNIWNEWCNPTKIPQGLTSEERKTFQATENDLGKVYGYQWRNFNSADYDQLKKVVDKLKSDPSDRRMICSAWNPLELGEMALPPCHLVWGVQVLDGKLNLWWLQRSCDTFLGIPYNMASYALLLKLLALESNLNEGVLTGFLVDVHIYENHVDQVKEQLSRTPYDLPNLEIKNFKSIFDWEYTDIELKDYSPHPAIKADIAV